MTFQTGSKGSLMLAKINETLLLNTDSIRALKVEASSTGKWDISLKRVGENHPLLLGTYETEKEAIGALIRIQEKLREANCLVDLT